MTAMVNAGVISVHLVALSIWVGSMVTIAVFARASRRVLDDRSRVALFASVGRSFAVVGPVALAVAIVTGLVTAGAMSGWSGQVWAAGAVGVAVLAVSVVAMLQAHRMTGLRRSLADAGDHPKIVETVRRQAALAGGLRGVLGLLTIAAVVLEAVAVSAAH
jgi:uncharacterized membrane protein